MFPYGISGISDPLNLDDCKLAQKSIPQGQQTDILSQNGGNPTKKFRKWRPVKRYRRATPLLIKVRLWPRMILHTNSAFHGIPEFRLLSYPSRLQRPLAVRKFPCLQNTGLLRKIQQPMPAGTLASMEFVFIALRNGDIFTHQVLCGVLYSFVLLVGVPVETVHSRVMRCS